MRLGNLAVFLLLFEAVTGVGLMFHYRPVVGLAYPDLVDLHEVSGFGFVRGLHRWGAYAAVIVVWLHLLRVALRGAYAPPRRLNWTVGVALMILTLLLAATGYLLPWDQHTGAATAGGVFQAGNNLPMQVADCIDSDTAGNRSAIHQVHPIHAR